MNVETKKEVMIFRNTYNDMVFFSTSLSKKDVNGNYENGNIPVRFKKGVDLPDKTKIYIRNAWLSFYKKDIPNSNNKTTVPYIFINEFVTLEERIKETHVDISVAEQVDPFANFGKEVTISDEDLPF